MLEVQVHTLLLNEPFRIAHGVSTRREVLRVFAEGAVGEAPFVPYYGDDSRAAADWLREIEEPWSVDPRDGPRVATLALDLLRADREGRRLGVGLAPALGEVLLGLPKQSGAIAGCRSLSIADDPIQLAEVVRDRARQFRALKLKLGSGNVDLDEALVARAREAVPGVRLLADVNGGWSVADTLKMMRKLVRWRLELLEQPVHHEAGVEAWREIRAKRDSDAPPLVADESAQGAGDVAGLADLVAGVNVKLLKCGSLRGAAAMIRAARQHRLGVLLGCMIESSIGVTAAAHLAPWADAIDLDGHLYVANDDYDGLTYDAEGNLRMGEKPGIGVRRREEPRG